MKTKFYFSKKIFASILAIIFSSVLFMQTKAQNPCQAGFTFTVNNNVVTFTNTSTGGNPPNYSWNFGDGNYDWQTNPVHTYIYSGTYYVCLSMSDTFNQGCQSYFCDTVVITSAPNPPCNATFGYSVDTFQVNGVYFYNQSQYNVQWFWSFGDGTYDSTGNAYPIHQYATLDTFVVCLTAITWAGDTCSYCDTVINIPCTQLLNTSFTYSISGDTAFFISNCSGASTPSYGWSFGDGNYSNLQNPVHAYVYNGTYIACLSYGDTSCVEYICDTVTITNGTSAPCNAQFTYYVYPDTFQFPYDTIVQFIDQSTLNPVQWYWDLGDGNNSTQQNPVHQYAVSDTYYVCLTVINQSGDTCTTCDSVAARLLATGINQAAGNNLTLINFPNPFSNSTTISFSLEKFSLIELSVYTIMGEKISVLEKGFASQGTHRYEWQVNNLSAGVYWLSLDAGKKNIITKLVLIK